MVRGHGFGCVQQMQGQMHVHVTGLGRPVPLVGYFSAVFPSSVRPSPAPSPPPTAQNLRPLPVSVTARVQLGVI
ncbi:hypothetical protein C1I97_02310 [Streptomyces sp. NTH33]|nr:hypothetical protein C1I97_02310 [Streptomyces sp. NTH33]